MLDGSEKVSEVLDSLAVVSVTVDEEEVAKIQELGKI
jgi:hypothetical protein